LCLEEEVTNFPFLLTYTFLPKVEKLLQNHFSSASNPSAPKSNQSSITKAKEPSAAKSNQSSITKTKETTVKASVLNDKVDIIDQGIPIEWISVQKFNQRVCDCPYVEVTSTTPNIEAVFKTIEALSSKSFGLSTNMTIDDEIKKNGEKGIFSANSSIDFDSLITVQSSVSSWFVEKFKKYQLTNTYHTQIPMCENIAIEAYLNRSVRSDSAADEADDFMTWDRHVFDDNACKVVEMTIMKISESEMNVLSPIDDSQYSMTRNRHGSRMPTMGFETSKHMYLLPKSERNNDPFYSWIIVKDISKYKRCVRRVATYMLLMTKPADYVDAYKRINCKTFSKYRNSASIGGGLWVYRLAFILYCLEDETNYNDEKNTTYEDGVCFSGNCFISETFNMKTRTMSVSFKDMYTGGPSSTWNLFNESRENADADAEIHRVTDALVDSILKNTASIAYSMMRFALLNICDSCYNVGIGLQYEAFKSIRTNGNRNKVMRMWPAQPSSLVRLDKQTPSIKRVEYSIMALPGSLANSTETNQAFSKNNMGLNTSKVSSNKKKKLDKDVLQQVNNVFGPNSLNASNCAVHEVIRTQLYYLHMSNALGGRKEKHEHKASTSCMLSKKIWRKRKSSSNNEGNDFEKENDSDDGDDANRDDYYDYDNANDYANEEDKGEDENGDDECLYEQGDLTSKCIYIEQYANETNMNMKEPLLHSATIRQEVAHVIKLWQNNDSTSDCNDAYMKEWMTQIFRKPVIKCIEIAKERTVFVDVGEMVKYSSLVINCYIYLYQVGLYTLKHGTGLSDPEMKNVAYFLKHVQDALGLFYSGDKRPVTYGPPHKKSKYFYTVNLYPIGIKLNRPFTMMYTLPKVIRQNCGISAITSSETLFPNIHSNGLILVRRLKSAALKRFTIFQELMVKGHNDGENVSKKDLNIYKCEYNGCKDSFYFSNESFFTHLRNNPSHKKYPGDTDRLTSNNTIKPVRCTKVVINSVYNQMVESLKCGGDPASRAFDLLCKGKNMFIAGDAGSGKSFLLRKLVKWSCLMYNDWASNQGNKNASHRVAGVCFQNSAAGNVSSRFQTIHSFLGIGFGKKNNVMKDTEFMDISQTIDYIQAFLSDYDTIRQRLRKLEVLFVDEVGTVEDRLGSIMMLMIRVARGYYNNANDDIYSSEYSTLREIQLVVVGQVTQMQPIADKYQADGKSSCNKITSWAMTRDLLDMVEPIQLLTHWRSNACELLQIMIKRAKRGVLTDDDIAKLRVNSIKNNEAKRLYESNVFEDSVQVTTVAYQREDIWRQNINRIKQWKKMKPALVFTSVYADDEFTNSFNNKAYEIEQNGTELRFYEPTQGVFTMAKKQKYAEDKTLDIYFDIIYHLSMCKGMRMLISKNAVAYYYGNDANNNGYTPNSNNIKATLISIPKGTFGIVEDFVYVDQKLMYIGLKMVPPSEEGIPANPTPEDTKILYFTKSHQRTERDMIAVLSTSTNRVQQHRGALTRKQFPFKYGSVVSWMTIQGLTVPYLHLDLKTASYNSLLFRQKNPICVFALFYVTLSRVTRLRNIYIEFPLELERLAMLRLKTNFLNFVSDDAVESEIDFIERAGKQLKKATNRSNLEEEFSVYFESSHHFVEFKNAMSVEFLNYEEKEREALDITKLGRLILRLQDALYISFSGELEAFNPRQKEIYDTMKQVTGGDTNANAKQLEQREHFTLHINSQLKVIFSEGNDIVCYHKGKDSAPPCKKPKHGTSSSKAFLTPLQKSLATFSDLVEDCKYFYTSDENSEIQYEVWTTADEREARTCCWIQLIDIRENGENETYVVADTYTCADE